MKSFAFRSLFLHTSETTELDWLKKKNVKLHIRKIEIWFAYREPLTAKEGAQVIIGEAFWV